MAAKHNIGDTWTKTRKIRGRNRVVRIKKIAKGTNYKVSVVSPYPNQKRSRKKK